MPLGCDGCTRDCARLSADHFLPAVDKACAVRHRRIWGGNTKRKLSSPKKKFFGGEGYFLSL